MHLQLFFFPFLISYQTDCNPWLLEDFFSLMCMCLSFLNHQVLMHLTYSCAPVTQHERWDLENVCFSPTSLASKQFLNFLNLQWPLDIIVTIAWLSSHLYILTGIPIYVQILIFIEQSWSILSLILQFKTFSV